MLGDDLPGGIAGTGRDGQHPLAQPVFGQEDAALLAGKAGQVGHDDGFRAAGHPYFDVPTPLDRGSGQRILIDHMVFRHLIMVDRFPDTGIESQVREDFEAIEDILAYQIGHHHGVGTFDDQRQGNIGTDTGHGDEKEGQKHDPQRFAGQAGEG